CFFFSSRRRHTRFSRDWSSDVCSSDLEARLDQEHAEREPEREQTEPDGEGIAGGGPQRRVGGASLVLGHAHTVAAATTLARCRRSEERRVGKGGTTGGRVEPQEQT